MAAMPKPTGRVLAVLEVLQAEHRVSGAELARRTSRGITRSSLALSLIHI